MPITAGTSYHKYDVENYYDIDPQFGTLEDMKNLVQKAHAMGIDIIIDLVVNHSSSNHPWFKAACEYLISHGEPGGEYGDYYNFSQTQKQGYQKVPGSAWYYECQFTGTMPDLNLDSSNVRDEVKNIMKFWLQDIGIDGFRLDAVKYYYYENIDKNVPVLTWLEQTAKKYDPNFYMVGECWSAANVVNNYHRSELDSFFRFEGSYEGAISIMNVAKGRSKSSKFIDDVVLNVNAIKANNSNGYPSYFMSNHDMNRAAHAFQNENQAKAAASLLAFLPGTSYMYYGEEIGMLGKRNTSPDDLSDARRRLPMIWSETDKTGECRFPESSRQDLANNDQVSKGVNDRLNENFSLIKHYQKAINIRNKYDFIKQARVESLIANLNTEFTNVMAYKLYQGNDYIIVVHNFNEQNVQVTVNGSQIVDSINTSHQIPTYSNNTLTIGAYSTVIIK